jgi:hypothetical protein
VKLNEEESVEFKSEVFEAELDVDAALLEELEDYDDFEEATTMIVKMYDVVYPFESVSIIDISYVPARVFDVGLIYIYPFEYDTNEDDPVNMLTVLDESVSDTLGNAYILVLPYETV